jgi:hypothetical protein
MRDDGRGEAAGGIDVTTSSAVRLVQAHRIDEHILRDRHRTARKLRSAAGLQFWALLDSPGSQPLEGDMVTLANIRRGLTLALFVLVPLGGSAVAADAKIAAAGGATFGDKPAFQSDDNIDYGLSDDKKAFTIAFKTAFEATVGNIQNAKNPEAPVGTKVFSVVIPVNGKPIDTTFIVTTFVSAEEGASGALLFTVNDKTTVTRFAPGEGREVLVKLNYRARSVSDVRLTLVLLAQRDQAHPKATALVHVTTIDTDAALAKKRSTKNRK